MLVVLLLLLLLLVMLLMMMSISHARGSRRIRSISRFTTRVMAIVDAVCAGSGGIRARTRYGANGRRPRVVGSRGRCRCGGGSCSDIVGDTLSGLGGGGSSILCSGSENTTTGLSKC